ncbi:MAG: gamma-glutamyl-gamma-aminobutyrate hydrolase family protein [Actinobacteria bacterium]|nr:gamma-glutamyl-gamma-aminobutyrate hydrolase family protein [Actinomycetota bacterium]
MSVTLVLTEHSGALSPETLGRYEAVRGQLERAAGTPVATVRYEEVTSLQGAAAVVLSGSFAPWAAHAPSAIDRLADAVRSYDGPVLGICAGMQLQARFAGGTIRHSPGGPELGFSAVEVVEQDGLFESLPAWIDVYQHHGDEIEVLPPQFRVLARSASCEIEAIVDPARRWWGTQFHPEEFDAAHPAGERILRNFFELAGSSG